MTPPRDVLRQGGITLGLICLGTFGGWLGSRVSLPMPWMLGSLLSSALVVIALRPALLTHYAFPMRFRMFFIGLIGVMIGAQVTMDLLRLAGELPITMLALAAFVLLAHGGNMAIFRRIGGLDRATAFYSGTPGGLMESILLGEAAGADVKVLTAQQFLRIILVIALVPLGISLWIGAPVGSAAGQGFGPASGSFDIRGLFLASLLTVGGLALSRLVRMPAGHLVGPLLLAAALSVSGLLSLDVPFWMIAAAQVVIGVSLGLRFQGMSRALLQRSAWLSLLSVGYMLLLGAGFAALLLPRTDIPFLHLFISFAPGGVTEMSVIALSLAGNPALVSLHHVARILMTVVELSLLGRALGLRQTPSDESD